MRRRLGTVKEELNKLPFAARPIKIPQKRSRSVKLIGLRPQARFHYASRPFLVEDLDITDYCAIREFKNGSSPIDLCVKEPSSPQRPGGRRIAMKNSYSCEDLRVRPPQSPVTSSPRSRITRFV